MVSPGFPEIYKLMLLRRDTLVGGCRSSAIRFTATAFPGRPVAGAEAGAGTASSRDGTAATAVLATRLRARRRASSTE